MSEEKLKVDVVYGSLSASFTGNPDEVYLALTRFLSQNIPALDIAKKIMLKYDLQELINMFSDYVKITDEGPRIMPKEDLSIKQKITLQLVGNRIAYLLNKAQEEAMTLQDLISSLGLPSKSISSRLSELVKAGHVARIQGPNSTKYQITTLGIKWLSDTLTGKVKAD